VAEGVAAEAFGAALRALPGEDMLVARDHAPHPMIEHPEAVPA
jgi:hypothetical protein